jgi:hypothetical protein
MPATNGRNFIAKNVKNELKRSIVAAKAAEVKNQPLVINDRSAFFASIFRAGLTLYAVIPLDTALSGARLCTGRYIMISYAFYAFVSVYIVDIFTCWVIVIVNNGLNRTLVYTSSAANAGICNNYSHFFLLFNWYVALYHKVFKPYFNQHN